MQQPPNNTGFCTLSYLELQTFKCLNIQASNPWAFPLGSNFSSARLKTEIVVAIEHRNPQQVNRSCGRLKKESGIARRDSFLFLEGGVKCLNIQTSKCLDVSFGIELLKVLSDGLFHQLAHFLA